MIELLELFFVFFKIGAFSFGGGYGMLPVIEQEVVHNYNWLEAYEFIDIIAISQMSPGPIAINTATFIGFKNHGFIGGVIATLGVVSFSFILVIFIASLLNKFKDSKIVEGIFTGIRPAIIGLILAACISLFKTSIIDIKSLIIGIISLIILLKFKLHPIGIVFISGFMGILFYSF